MSVSPTSQFEGIYSTDLTMCLVPLQLYKNTDYSKLQKDWLHRF